MGIFKGFDVVKHSGRFVDLNVEMNTNVNVFTMKRNQLEVYHYRNAPYFIMSEPPGAGKSTTIKFVSSYLLLLKENPNLKIVIAIPQSLIAKSFGKIILEFPDGSQSIWDVQRNLCDDNNNGSKVQQLKNFILKSKFSNDINDRVVITTHQSLARLYDITNESDFNDVMFIIDEAHHVLYPENGEVKCANKIGAFIGSLINSNNPTIKCWFVTATFFRGDNYAIIPKEIMDRFVNYCLTLDEYWEKYIKHIKSFSYDFIIYKQNDIWNEIKEIIKTKGKRKTIIFCPYTGHLLYGINKYKFRDMIVKAIKEVWPECRILDLVSEHKRRDKKQIVIESSEEFDVILSVRLFDEGTDWAEAESIIDLVPSNSLRIQYQRFGRLIRDVPGKSHIDYNAFFPFRSTFENEEDRRVHLSKSLNALVASAILHEAIEPVSYPGKAQSTKPENKSESAPRSLDPFLSVVQDDGKRQEILSEVLKDLAILKNAKDEDPSKEEALNCITSTLQSFDINENLEIIATHITKILRKATMGFLTPDWKVQGLNIEWMQEAGFDKVWSTDIYDGLLAFTSGMCGIKTFQEFREVYSSVNTPDENVKIAEKLASDNGGKLQTNAWLKKNGNINIVQCKYKYPELFAHIPQEKAFKSSEESVKIAEKLASDNGGKLQTNAWLKKNGHYDVATCKYKYPELFAHIPQEKNYYSSEESVKMAEKLAADNEGKLQTTKELKEKGYYYVINAIYNHPELFAHIPRERNCRTPEESVKMAEKLASDNGGKLQTNAWLKKNGKEYITTCKRNHPELFSHIPQEKKKTGPKKEL